MIFSTTHAFFSAGGGCLQQAPVHDVDNRRDLPSPILVTFPELTSGQSYWSGHEAQGSGKVGHGIRMRVSGWGRVDILAFW